MGGGADSAVQQIQQAALDSIECQMCWGRLVAQFDVMLDGLSTGPLSLACRAAFSICFLRNRA